MQKHLIGAAMIWFLFQSIARSEEASRIMTVLVSYTHLSKDSNGMEVLRIELFDDRSARVLQYGASGTPYYTNTLAKVSPHVAGQFEKLVREKANDRQVESDAKWPSLISVAVYSDNTLPASVSWVADRTRSCVPRGLKGYEELQEFFNKLPILDRSEIRFKFNNSDQFHDGGPPVELGKSEIEAPKRPVLKPEIPVLEPQSNSTIEADF